MSLRALASVVMVLWAASILAACAPPSRGPAVRAADVSRAFPLGIPHARFYADGDPAPMIAEATLAIERIKATLRAEGRPSQPIPPSSFLAISGGADNGAFGAGLINGWTTTGTRPEFRMVTGISTGALIAPFAFLGPSYDGQLREVYTELGPDSVFSRRAFTAALFSDAMAGTRPLAETIDRYVDDRMLAAIGREYERGRLLMLGTTDLDAQRPVIWNIGAIAASGHPQALDLFRKILLATAAIPGAFPPVMIGIKVDGARYQEMHVDGGVNAQLFLYPGSFDPLTNGHVDIITRGARLFERIVVAILVNIEKSSLFSVPERIELAREVFADLPNVEVDTFGGLLVDYARVKQASVVVRGLRAVSDFEYEMQMALMNRRLNPSLETVFMMPAEEYSYVSSRLVKEVFALGGDITGLVPTAVEARLKARGRA